MSEPAQEYEVAPGHEIMRWLYEQFANAGIPVETIKVFHIGDDKWRAEGQYHGWGRLALFELRDEKLHIMDIAY